MTERGSFLRKVVYLAVMAGLLLPISALSLPATVGTSGQRSQPGGVLAQRRQALGLSQANLGEIDPTSETIKLATLGMKGLAVNLLWGKAQDFQKKQDWSSLSATLEQIIRLQPNMISVWQYQAWNLAYNVSAEWDDFRDRYSWVIKGILFLEEGTRYNHDDPDLIREMGRFTSQKIGRADEHKQFRRMFRKDDDFHRGRPPERRDNWLVGKEFYRRAEEIIETNQLAIHRQPQLPGLMYAEGPSPLLFYSDAPLCAIHHADALLVDGGPDGRGVFGQKAELAWRQAAREWEQFGRRELQTSNGELIHLLEREKDARIAAELLAKLEALAPGLRQRLSEEKISRLNEDERAVIAVPVQERTAEQHMQAQALAARVEVTHLEVAESLPAEKREEGRKLAEEAARYLERARLNTTYRGIVNYEYWAFRCKLEGQPDTVDAHKLIAEGDYAYLVEADMPKAKSLYNEAFQKWRKVLYDEQFRPLWNMDDSLVEDIMASIANYITILKGLDEELPKDFPLSEFMQHVTQRKMSMGQERATLDGSFTP